MKEQTLLRIALVCSLVGLVALYFISIRMEAKYYNPVLSGKDVGDNVKFSGTVSKVSDRGDVVFIDVVQQSPVNVVLFTGKDVSLKDGDNVDVEGEVQEYNGKDEIIAQKIMVKR